MHNQRVFMGVVGNRIPGRSVMALLAISASGMACGFSPSYPVGNPCGADGACPPGQACGADNICQLPSAPAPVPGDVDAAVVQETANPTCAVAGNATSFHLDFDDSDPYRDRIGGALIADVLGTVTPGESLCGTGSARFEASGALIVPDAPLWDDVGSIDLTLRIFAVAASAPEAVLSRDASGTEEPGHLWLAVTSDGRIIVRLQNDGTTYLCTEADQVRVGEWQRIGLNFGEPETELWLDGVKAEFTGLVGDIDCSLRANGLTMTGNAEPLALGANTNASTPGTIEPNTTQFSGELDEFVVNSERGEFAQ